MIHFKLKTLVWLIAIWLIFPGISLAQKKSTSVKLGLGIEVGNWRPDDLSDAVALSPVIPRVKKHPYLGLMALKPWRFGMTFRCSPGYWRYSNDEPLPEKKAVEIISLLFDLKYSLLSDVRVLPYVSYGVGIFFGQEATSEKPILQNIKQAEMGAGVNVGTGFDFKITNRLFIALEFRYHYVKFKHVLVFTDNYSGPKISMGFFYLF